MTFPEFRPIRLADAARLKQLTAANTRPSCECAPANLLLWAEPYRMEWAELEGRLLILGREERLLHFPIGDWFPPGQLAELTAEATARGRIDGAVYDAPPEYFTRFPDAERFFRSECDPGSADYLYDLRQLAELSGGRLRKKRNLIRQFEAAHPDWSLVPLSPDLLPVAAELARMLNARLTDRPFLHDEALAMTTAWNHFEAIGLEGVLLYAAPGCPVGFSVFSSITPECFDIHFEKADHLCKGAAQMLTWQLARHLAPRGRRMNREQDMNEPGLRQAKESLDPCEKLARLLLRLK